MNQWHFSVAWIFLSSLCYVWDEVQLLRMYMLQETYSVRYCYDLPKGNCGGIDAHDSMGNC